MPRKLYAKYSIEDFDKFDCLKLSKGIYLLLLFVLRGYIVWLMSVTNMQDRTGTIQLIYPQQSLFYLSLLSGAIGLFIVLIITLRRPEAPSWIKFCWSYCRVFFVTALCFDFFINIVGYFYWKIISLNWLLIQATIILMFIVFLYKSQRVKLNIREFPQKLPE